MRKKNKLVIFRDAARTVNCNGDTTFLSFEELIRLAVQGSLLRRLFYYQEVVLVTHRFEVMLKPFLTCSLLRLLSHGQCLVRDDSGKVLKVSITELMRMLMRLLADSVRKYSLVADIGSELETLSLDSIGNRQDRVDFSLAPVYLRTDLWFGLPSGGSVGHIAGVLNNLENFTGKPIFFTTDLIPTVRKDIETHYIHPDGKFWDFTELPSFLFNKKCPRDTMTMLQKKDISFIYQRYSLNNYTGVKLKKSLNVPFVLEYNGSEIWVARHWGKPLKYEDLSRRIEFLNLTTADVIVVVSDPLRAELIGRGIDRDKILVNPNGVEADRYAPVVDGSATRNRYNLDGKIIIGFIGTFGRWHGAEVLAEAFGSLLEKYPAYRDSVRLLMIGDGMTMPLVKEVLAKYAVGDACILAGRVPQEQGPEHLAACDILASPHVPNPDGTPFFGSPTKLFEYMAMGKGIVASDLDQIGEILEHEKTAWMAKPGDPESLMHGLKKLIDDAALRENLGRAAREEVVANYTWTEHTRKIVEKLQEVVSEANRRPC